MKQKYINTQTIMACLSKPPKPKKNIYEQLKETIEERKKIIRRYEEYFQAA